MRTSALIFDMDATMVDSMPFHVKSWLEFTRRHGIEVDVQELLRRPVPMWWHGYATTAG